MAQTSSGVARSGWAIAAGVLSTLQAGGYLGLGITALATYYCEIIPDVSSANPGFLLYVTYFYNPACENSLNGPSGITWPTNEFQTAIRTWQWAIAFCALDALWLFMSFFLTVAGAVRSQRAIFRRVIPALWLVATAAVLVADVVASIFYGLDLGKVLNAEEEPMLALLTDVDPKSGLYKLLQEVPRDAAILPSIALLIAVSRGTVLWLLNLMFFIVIALNTFRSMKKPVKQSRALASSNAPERRAETHHHGTQNPAYDRMGDDDYSSKQRQKRRQRDADLLAAEAQRRESAELRNQRPWSYLEPQEQVRNRPRTPPAEEWQYPHESLKLPRATLAHQQPTAPYQQQPAYNQQFYHYPSNHSNRYADQSGRSGHRY